MDVRQWKRSSALLVALLAPTPPVMDCVDVSVRGVLLRAFSGFFCIYKTANH